jgi:hypothetical protein
LIQRSTPYVQRINVPNKTVEEVYKTVTVWLINNNCSLTTKNPPTYFEAKYSANFPLIQVGPRDEHPKTIIVRISPFGSDVLLYFTFTQQIDRVGNSGYIFWGLKLGELCEELGVNVTDTLWSELVPESVVKKIINSRFRLLIVLLVCSVFIFGYLWERVMEFSVLYFIVFMVPFMLLVLWDLQEHRRLLKREIDRSIPLNEM